MMITRTNFPVVKETAKEIYIYIYSEQGLPDGTIKIRNDVWHTREPPWRPVFSGDDGHGWTVRPEGKRAMWLVLTEGVKCWILLRGPHAHTYTGTRGGCVRAWFLPAYSRHVCERLVERGNHGVSTGWSESLIGDFNLSLHRRIISRDNSLERGVFMEFCWYKRLGMGFVKSLLWFKKKLKKMYN